MSLPHRNCAICKLWLILKCALCAGH
uniref:Uncharacterized protein n=1 Tax=Arundo donax TaxID=35708 RepID=A0A0A9HK80_ARUDO